jgi:soluble lytic murein transglycosylase-like protein
MIRGAIGLVAALVLHDAATAGPLTPAETVNPGQRVARGRINPVHVERAAARFALPSDLVWAVIAAESDGRPDAVSSAGAMGLMQLMPATWAMLRARLALGEDPFDPADNILAGAAYLRELLDRYGDPGFLAAYNAGPGRYEASLSGQALPAETRAYVARIAQRLVARPLAARSSGRAEERLTGLFPAPWPTALGEPWLGADRGQGEIFASRREAMR